MRDPHREPVHFHKYRHTARNDIVQGKLRGAGPEAPGSGSLTLVVRMHQRIPENVACLSTRYASGFLASDHFQE